MQKKKKNPWHFYNSRAELLHENIKEERKRELSEKKLYSALMLLHD